MLPKSSALISPTTTVAPSNILSSSGVLEICVVDTAARTGNVPDTFGKLIVLSPVASIVDKLFHDASAVEPSNTTALLAFIVTELVIV